MLYNFLFLANIVTLCVAVYQQGAYCMNHKFPIIKLITIYCMGHRHQVHRRQVLNVLSNRVTFNDICQSTECQHGFLLSTVMSHTKL